MAVHIIEVKSFLKESNCILRVNIRTVLFEKYIFLCPFIPTSEIRNKIKLMILTMKKRKVVNPLQVFVSYFLLKIVYKSVSKVLMLKE